MKRVLITGGTGFIARHIISPLIQQGYEVHVISSRSTHYSMEQVHFHTIELLDCQTHGQFMKQIKPTHLVHAAWYTENGKFWEAVENVYWLQASISLVDAFYSVGGQRVLGLGTCAEYDWHDGLCVEGKTAEVPISLYGKAKKSSYDCLTALSKSYSQSFAWARVFFPFGPGESEKRLIAYSIKNLLLDQPVQCTHGNQLRDFLYVSEMGQALAAVFDSEVTGVLNIGSGVATRIKDVVSCIASLLKKEHLVQFGAIAEPTYSPPKILADVQRLNTEVRWKSKLTLEESLLKTINWWAASMALTQG